MNVNATSSRMEWSGKLPRMDFKKHIIYDLSCFYWYMCWTMLYQLGIWIEDLQHVLHASHPDKTLLSHRFWKKKVARQHNMFHTTSNLPDFLGLPWSLHLRFTLDKKSVKSDSVAFAAVIRSGKDAALAHGSRNMSKLQFQESWTHSNDSRWLINILQLTSL